MKLTIPGLLFFALSASAVHAGTRPIELEVPLPPTLSLRTGARIGFLEIREDGAYTWVHPGGELINAMRRDLFRAGNLRLVDAPAAPLPEQRSQVRSRATSICLSTPENASSNVIVRS